MTRSLLACLLALLAACGGGDGDSGDGPDGGTTGDGSDVFARDLLEVRIDMDPALWDEMRHQIKTRQGQYGREDCRDAPAPNPYTWFAATVTIDGEEIPVTGVRKKGNLGSQSTLIPSIKLRFDEFVNGQQFHGLNRLALNNSKSDQSYARTCLGYAAFAAAGFASPRCTYAHVVVNGQDLGPYVAIDEVHSQFLARNFERADGNLYEGTASDFRDDAIGGFEQETNEDSDASRADLQAVLDALLVDDDQLRGRLSEVVNLPEFIRFWALESLIWHRDGYSGHANNFFIYADPADGGRFRFIPWGPDAAFRADDSAEVPDSVLAYGVIANRLYAIPAERNRYYQALAKLLENHWDPDAMTAEAARVSELVRQLLPAEARGEHDADRADLEAFIAGRRAALEEIMAGVYPDWTDGLRVLPCRPPVAPVSGSFTTSWNSLEDDIYAAGSATIGLELEGETMAPTQSGARSGFNPMRGQDRVQLVYDLSGGRRLTFNINFPEDRWFESYMTPGSYPLLSPPMAVTVLYDDNSVTPAVSLGRFEMGEGTWIFDEVDLGDGSPVSGSFEATLYLPPESLIRLPARGMMASMGDDHQRRVYDSMLGLLASEDNPTPMVRLRRVVPFAHAQVYAKLEWYNPFGAVKDRVAANMVRDAEEKGALAAGVKLVEPTSGNTGMGLAMVGNAKGYALTTPLSSAIPQEKRSVLRFFGVDVIELSDALCPAPGQPEGAMQRAAEIAQQPDFHQLNQYENPANPGAHYRTTGPEIWRQTDGKVTHFVAGLGTCGTITGTGRLLKEKNRSVKVLGAHPAEGHDIPGVRSITQLRLTRFYVPAEYDGQVEVSDEEAFEMCLRLNREESVVAGPSSGMALAGALKLVPDEPGVVAVVLFPDNVFKYTTSMQRHFPRMFPADRAAAPDPEASSGVSLTSLLDNLRRSADVIDVGQMEDLLDGSPPPTVIDVRKAEDYQQERMEGSINIPLPELTADSPQLPGDRSAPIVTVCNVGRQSLTGLLVLKSLGYRNVKNLMGGLTAWSAEGHPLES